MSNTTSTLNDLIETLKDGQDGFRAAAADVDSSELKTLFAKYSLQRSKFVGELQTLQHTLGDHDPANAGSVSGALHRGWINIKAAISSRDNHAILAECERGEDVTVAAYKSALEDQNLPENVADLLRSQQGEVKAAHDCVRNLRDSKVSA